MGLVDRGRMPGAITKLMNIGRSYSMWVYQWGLACCAIEMGAAFASPRYDVMRLGVIPLPARANRPPEPLPATTRPVASAAARNRTGEAASEGEIVESPDLALERKLRTEIQANLGDRLRELDVRVNDRDVANYFPSKAHQMILTEPLRLTSTDESYDIDATLHGGGVSGQAGALRLGIARALVELDSEMRTTLKRAGFLSRDQREKESKKYGLKKARKAPQYSKR